MNKVTNVLLLSCLRATELIEKRMYFKLTFRERLAMRLHLSMCQACKLYEKQSSLIDDSIAFHLSDKTECHYDVSDLKLRIRNQLENQAGS